MNKFESLSAENEVSAFAKMTPEESAEFNAYLDHLDYLDGARGMAEVDEIPA